MAADAVANNGDLAAAARQYEAQSREPGRALVPLLRAQRPDAPEDARRRCHGGHADAPGAAGAGGLDIFGAATSAAPTPSSSTSLLRVVNLLEPPDALWARLPELQRSAAEAAAAAATRRAARPLPRPPRPSRDEILAVVA